MSLENLVSDFEKKAVFILSIGIRKSGKSYNSLALIKHAMEKNIFTNYIMCLPVYDFEETDSYDFIKKYVKQNPKKIRIFDRYSYLITRELMKSAGKNKKQKILLFIDR